TNKTYQSRDPIVSDIQRKDLQLKTHQKFTSQYGGKVFYIFSSKVGDRKEIQNKEVINEIKQEIERLNRVDD
ncbi:MAG: hypothetical protein V2B13_15540, partial [Pseudomonadota bacterium]